MDSAATLERRSDVISREIDLPPAIRANVGIVAVDASAPWAFHFGIYLSGKLAK
jgi:hypothetical protein